MIKNNQELLLPLAQELLLQSIEEKKQATLKSDGFSMSPLITPGDEITFVKKDNFRFGDILMFRNNSFLCGHRFIRKTKIDNKEFLVLKADASWNTDRLIRAEDIIGVVTRVRNKFRAIELNTFKGKLISLFCFFVSFLNLVFKSRLFLKNKNIFENELELIKLLIDSNKHKYRIEGLKEKLSEYLDWGYLTEKIKWNFLSAYFIQEISSLGLKDAVPDKAWQKIENVRWSEVANDTQNRSILAQILSAFNQQGIKPLLTKGIQLGLEVYEDTYLRRMQDIDILVKFSDWAKSCEILKNLGFNVSQEENLGAWGLKYLDNHIDFFKNNTRVELKTNIWAVDAPNFNQGILSRAREVNLATLKAYFPSFEDTLLIACVNLMRRNFCGLIWFLDIRKIINKLGPLIDWRKFIANTKEHDLTVAVYYALKFTEELACPSLPLGLLGEIRPSILRRELFDFYWLKDAILLKKEAPTARVELPFEFVLFVFGGKLKFQPRKLLKFIRYLFIIVFPPKEYMRDKYRLGSNIRGLLRFYCSRLSRLVFTSWHSLVSVIFKKYG